MTTLLRYQPKQTLERRYSSSTSSNHATSPSNETNMYVDSTHNQYQKPHSVSYLSENHGRESNPHYQYIESLYHDKQRELLYVQHILYTQWNTINTSYNAISEVFYKKQRDTLLQW